MNLNDTIAPKSDQVNAEDFLAGPRTVTITAVRPGTEEQPVNIDLAEYPGRAYRPGKSMRRVLVAAWGTDSSVYLGRRLTLFCDPSVKFGGSAVGGIRISAMSDIPKRLNLSLTTTRGKKAPFTVDPLPDVDPRITRMAILRGEWGAADPERKKEIQAEVAELQKAVSGE